MMPRRLRKAIQRLTPNKTRETKTNAQPRNGQEANVHYEASLLGLPPEIRNQIYEDLALDSTLCLSTTKARKPPPPIGLLFACRQTHREYRSLLFSTATVLVSVTEYNFSNLVRVLEKLSEADVSSLKMNSQLWISIHLEHVPSRENRRNLKGWLDYRNSSDPHGYFGPGRVAANELDFHYGIRFLNQMRPPRHFIRYANGYQMKADLLRSHIRVYRHLEFVAENESPNGELKRLQEDLEESAKVLEDLEKDRPHRLLGPLAQGTNQLMGDAV